MAIDITALREAFPVTREWIYLNHASVAPISIHVQRAMQTQLRDVAHNGMVNSDRWEQTYARTRRIAAKLIGARPSEIAFVKNTTEGIHHLANGLRWKKNDNVIIPDRGFPANVYPWLNLSSRGVETRMVPEEDGRIDPEQIFAQTDKHTRVISISSVEFASGFRHDLTKIGDFCKENNILFFVDAIQSLGALNLNIEQCNIDVLSADAHKWMLGPEGAGIFYCARKIMRHLKVTNLGWASVINPGDYLNYDITPLPNARRFESGTLNTVGIYGVKASLDLIARLDISNIEARILMLADQLATGLKEKGYHIISSRKPNEKSGIVTFQHSDLAAEAIFEQLKDHKIIGAIRGGSVRLSPHVYNTEDEIDHVPNVLP